MKLHKESVTDPLWNLLLSLMQLPELNKFRLVGGTALALHLGHRQSVDIDLFSDTFFDVSCVIDSLVATHDLLDVTSARNSVSGLIDGIKIDIITHQYPWIDDAVKIDGIRIASISDIVAMKLNAISNSGSKKDFWDISALLQQFTFAELLGDFSKRYPHMNSWQIIRLMTYFEDAEQEPDPVVLNDSTWQDVKISILAATKEILKR